MLIRVLYPVPIAIVITKWSGQSLAVETEEKFEDSMKRYMEGREYTWEELSSALDKAIEDHCPPEREKYKPWMTDRRLSESES